MHAASNVVELARVIFPNRICNSSIIAKHVRIVAEALVKVAYAQIVHLSHRSFCAFHICLQSVHHNARPQSHTCHFSGDARAGVFRDD